MSEKCELCNEEIKETFLGKLDGAVVKVKDGDKNKLYYACSGCQKKHGDKLKEELESGK